ncbi:MAG: prepilin peptidase [Sneathiella sp.]
MLVEIGLKSITLFLPLLAIFVMLYAAFTDWTTRRIPNKLSLCLVVLFGTFTLMPGCVEDVMPHMLVSLGMLLILLPVYAMGKMGGGDVKLLVASGLWMGNDQITEFILYVSFAGAVLTLILISENLRNIWEWGAAQVGLQSTGGAASKATGIPYGVAISFGGIVLIYKSYVL